jgi:hypothetical protein
MSSEILLRRPLPRPSFAKFQADMEALDVAEQARRDEFTGNLIRQQMAFYRHHQAVRTKAKKAKPNG